MNGSKGIPRTHWGGLYFQSGPGNAFGFPPGMNKRWLVGRTGSRLLSPAEKNHIPDLDKSPRTGWTDIKCRAVQNTTLQRDFPTNTPGFSDDTRYHALLTPADSISTIRHCLFPKSQKVNSMSKTVWRCWTQRKARVRHSSIFAGSTKNIPHSFPTCFVHLYHVQTPIKHHRGAQFLTHCLSFVSFKTKPPKTSLQIHYFGWKDH